MGPSTQRAAPLRHPGLGRTAGGRGTQPRPANLADQVSPDACARSQRQAHLHNGGLFFFSCLWPKKRNK